MLNAYMDTMNVNNKLLIWSKDRACQLHLLLEGIERHLPNLFDISVLYTESSMAFDRGYKMLRERFIDVEWIRERNFHDDTMGIIEESDLHNICLSTDDTVIYRTPPAPPINYVGIGEVFSYRLGLNTILQNPHDGTEQPPLVNPFMRQGILSWSAMCYGPTMNYGYPFGLDMHAYNREQFLSLITLFDWNNTSELEGNLFRYRYDCPNMYAFEHSVAFNVPLNKLSNTIYNGEKTRTTMSDLNDKYLNGQRIDLDKIEQLDVIGCHQFIDLEFIDG